MAKEIDINDNQTQVPDQARAGDGSDPFAQVSPVDPQKIKSEPGQDAAPGANRLPAEEAPDNYFNPGAPQEPQNQEKPIKQTVEEPSSEKEPKTEIQEPSTQKTEEQASDPSPKEPEENLVEGKTGNWEKNYKELRSKFNERDDEISTLRSKVKELEALPTQNKEIANDLQETKKLLSDYEKWYNENYPVFKKAVEDPQLAARLREIQKEISEPLTKEQIMAIAKDAYAEEYEIKQQSQMIDTFVDGNKDLFEDPLIQSGFKKSIEAYPDGFSFDKATLSIILKTVQQELGMTQTETPKTENKEDREKKIADTQVGKGISNPPPTPKTPQTNESLFMRPPGSVGASGIFGQW